MNAAPRTYNVLFLCTGNSARSIMAEAILNDLGRGRFRAYSAGSAPNGRVNPLTLALLAAKGLPTQQLRSKSWSEFEAPSAPRMDIVITVCDNAAGEACPIWPGHPAKAHWGFEDPAAHAGADAERRQVFEKVFNQISTRIRSLVALPVDTLDQASLQDALRALAEAYNRAP